ncbi:MAG: BrnA antitoxin family protein [Planctomycetes bacterium]|jgi:hypothetical protein|nr:BrnA antitoxin family protein [Planctomycetota bacterium]
MRTTVDIDRDLLESLRERAHREGVPFKRLLNRVLRRGLEAGRPTPGPCRCPAFSLGPPLRPLDKALALADAMEEEEVAREMALRK